MSTVADYLIQTALSLIAVLMLGALVYGAARRLSPRVPNRALELVGHLPLEARRAIYLVRVGSRVLIVGASEAGLHSLGDAPPDAVDLTPPARRSFADALNLSRKRNTKTGLPDGTASYAGTGATAAAGQDPSSP